MDRPMVASEVLTEGNRWAIRRERCLRSLYHFTKRAWPVVEPGQKFVDGHHIKVICDHLQAVHEGRIKRLAIAIPPGFAKSILVSVIFPAWKWAHDPSWRSIFASYSLQGVALRDSMRCRRLIESDWYTNLFRRSPDGTVLWDFAADANQKAAFETTRSGQRIITSPDGAATGLRGNAVVVDDPVNIKEFTQTTLAKVLTWFRKTLPTRVNDRRKDAFIVVMQRVDENDLIGYLKERGNYQILELPAEYDPERKSRTYATNEDGEEELFWEDWRTEPGELLFPGMFPQSVLDELRADMGDADFETQFNQRPSATGGTLFKRGWFRYWRGPTDSDKPPPDLLGKEIDADAPPPILFDPRACKHLTLSVDASFKDKTTAKRAPDFVVGTVWAQHPEFPSLRILVDLIRGQWGYTRTVDEIKGICDRYPAIRAVLVEDKANGPAIIETLKRDPAFRTRSVISINPGRDSKTARAQATTVIFKAGDVVIPLHKAWLKAYLYELLAFPGGKHDDQVDSTVQALLHLAGDPDDTQAFRALANLR